MKAKKILLKNIILLSGIILIPILSSIAHQDHSANPLTIESKIVLIVLGTIIVFVLGLSLGFFLLKFLPDSYKNKKVIIQYIIVLGIVIGINDIIILFLP